MRKVLLSISIAFAANFISIVKEIFLTILKIIKALITRPSCYPFPANDFESRLFFALFAIINHHSHLLSCGI